MELFGFRKHMGELQITNARELENIYSSAIMEVFQTKHFLVGAGHVTYVIVERRGRASLIDRH